MQQSHKLFGARHVSRNGQSQSITSGLCVLSSLLLLLCSYGKWLKASAVAAATAANELIKRKNENEKEQNAKNCQQFLTRNLPAHIIANVY